MQRPSDFHWRPPDFHRLPKLFIGDPQTFIGDHQILIGYPSFSLKTPKLSLETPRLSLETPRLSLETPRFSSVTQAFYLRPKSLNGRLYNMCVRWIQIIFSSLTLYYWIFFRRPRAVGFSDGIVVGVSDSIPIMMISSQKDSPWPLDYSDS